MQNNLRPEKEISEESWDLSMITLFAREGCISTDKNQLWDMEKYLKNQSWSQLLKIC